MNTKRKRWNTLFFKGILCFIWIVLFTMLLQRDYFIKTLEPQEAAALERHQRTGYQSIYFKDQKIGYVENEFLPQGDKLRIKQQAFMHLNISNQIHAIELVLDALIDSGNRLEQFNFTFSSPFYKMTASGEVENNSVSFTLDTGSSTIQDRIVLDAPPLLSTSRRRYLLTTDLEKGTKVRIPWFDPVSLTAKSSVIEYRGKEQVLIHGRVYNLHRFTELFSGTRVNSWLDDDGNVVKEESPAGFVFIREPEFKAKSLSETSSELLSSVSVKISAEMPDLTDRKTMRYRLTLPEETTFKLDSGRQNFNSDILTITKEVLPESTEIVRDCADSSGALAATPYTQAGASEIVEQSNEITAGILSVHEKAAAIAQWVYKSLDKRPVLGIPDALSTLKNRRGDCNEHASLFAALGRAAGIPTKIAAGVVFHKGAFYYHAWNEVCLSGRWISLDTTTMQFPADLSHIKFVEGELQEQVQIGALLGKLAIEPLP